MPDMRDPGQRPAVSTENPPVWEERRLVNRRLRVPGALVEVAPLVAVLGLAVAVRFLRLGSLESLWYDTASSIATSSNASWGAVLRAVQYEIQFPLYFLLLHLWLKVDTSEFWVRALSALFGVGVVGMVYVTGKAFFSYRVGLLAAALTAVSTYQIYYSRYPRSYILLAFFALLSIYFLREAFVKGGVRFWAGYAVATLLASYTHPYAFTLVLSQWLFAIVYIPVWNRRAALPWLASQATLIVGFAPWVPALLYEYRQQQAGVDSWIPPVTWRTVEGLLNWVWFRTRGDHGLSLNRALFYVRDLFTLLLVVGLFVGRRYREKALLVLAGVVPVAFVYVVSVLYDPIWVPRYFVFVAGPFAILLAYALGLLWERGWVGKGALVLSLGLLVFESALPLDSFFTGEYFRNADVRSASAWIRPQYQEGDVILHTNYQSYLPSVWYNRRAGLELQRPFTRKVLCIWRSTPRSWCAAAPYEETHMNLERLDFRQVSSARRVWLVVMYNHRAPERGGKELSRILQTVSSKLPRGYEGRLRQDFRGVAVVLYEAGGSGRATSPPAAESNRFGADYADSG